MTYYIDTPEDLSNILGDCIQKNQTSGNLYVIQNDLDCSRIHNFVPLGTGSNCSFDGKLDGNGHVIKNLMINSRRIYELGLFTKIGIDGKVKNLRCESVTISQDTCDMETSIALTRAGIIAAICEGEICGCSASGVITVEMQTDACQVGGLCGSLTFQDSKIQSSWTDVEIHICSNIEENGEKGTDKSYFAGGIVGSANGSISCCHSRSEIFEPPDNVTDYAAGGICGTADSCSSVTACYNIGYLHSRNVKGDALGGIVGKAGQGSDFSKCLYLKGCLLSAASRKTVNVSDTIGDEINWKDLISPGFALSKLGEDYADTPQDDYQYAPCLKLFRKEGKESCDAAYLRALCTPVIISFSQSVYPDTTNPVKVDCELSDCSLHQVSMTAVKPDLSEEIMNPTVSGDSFCCDLGNNKYISYDFVLTVRDRYGRSITVSDTDIEMKV